MRKNLKDFSPVHLRTKKIAHGKESIYLDIVKDGVRSKDFLGLYLVPEQTRADKVINRATMKTAEEIRAQRIVDLLEGRVSFVGEGASKVKLMDWLEEQRVYYHDNGNMNYSKTIHNLKRHIGLFVSKPMTMKDVTPAFLRRFLEYLRGNGVNKYGGRLCQETIYTYFTVLSILMNKAVRLEIIASNPFHKLSQAEKPQRRTKKLVYVPLSSNALKWLPERGYDGRENYIFKFRDRSIIYEYLNRWAEAAEVEKHVTFHMSRHTCATLLLYYGADLYTVSKILGHTSIKTTQVYAKVADEMKRKAVGNIPDV